MPCRAACRVEGRPLRLPGATPVDVAVAQGGAIADRQLLALGMSRTSIRRWVLRGRLHLRHPGVYALGHPLLSRPGTWHAAVLAIDDDALLAGRSAAHRRELVTTARPRIDVLTPRRGRRSTAAIQVHTTRRLHPDDVELLDGLPVSSVSRTLLDLAEVVSRQRLARAIEQALLAGTYDQRAVDRTLHRAAGRRGAARLRQALAVVDASPTLTRSGFERSMQQRCPRWGLPRPQANASVLGHEVDCFWPDAGLVVELDSRAFHLTPQAYERDRQRDRDLVVSGLRVVRITELQWTDERRVMHELAQLLGA